MSLETSQWWCHFCHAGYYISCFPVTTRYFACWTLLIRFGRTAELRYWPVDDVTISFLHPRTPEHQTNDQAALSRINLKRICKWLSSRLSENYLAHSYLQILFRLSQPCTRRIVMAACHIIFFSFMTPMAFLDGRFRLLLLQLCSLSPTSGVQGAVQAV